MEIQLYGKKLPTKKLDELHSLILNANFNPFPNIELFDLEILPFNSNKTKEFKILWEHDGFYTTKQKLNKNNNFTRDYIPFIKKKQWDTQPQQVFLEEMKKYFLINEFIHKKVWR